MLRACVAACVRVSVACVRGCMCLCECCVDAVRVHACVCVCVAGSYVVDVIEVCMASS